MPRVKRIIVELERTTVPEHQIVNGKWIHRIRQSDIKRFDHCADSHRRHLLKLDPPMNNDSAILGTVFAKFPETILNGESWQSAAFNTVKELSRMWNEPGLNQVTFDSYEHAAILLDKAMDTWLKECLPTIPKGSIPERKFSVKAYEDTERIILLEGTSDLWLPNGEIWDWKFSGRSYIGSQAWKNERYDPQPAHYSLARSLIDPVEVGKWNIGSFTFVNIRRDDTRGMNRESVVEWLPVPLTLGDFQFHMDRLFKMALFIETMVSSRGGWDNPWTLNPTDWWCSSTWCPSWDECRGKYIGKDPWGNLAKRLKNG